MRPARIIAIVAGAFVVLFGLALIAPGGFLLWAHGTQRDSSGFYKTPGRLMSSDGYALTSPAVNIDLGPGVRSWLPTGATAAVRIEAESTTSKQVFIGIADTDKVSQYLADVAHDEVTDFGWWGGVDYRHVGGSIAPTAPASQSFWAAQRQGSGSQVLEWEVPDGNWTLVVMNSDASPRVDANVSLGARFGILLPIGIGLLAGGVVLLGVGVTLILVGALSGRSGAEAYAGPSALPPSGQEQPPAAPDTSTKKIA